MDKLQAMKQFYQECAENKLYDNNSIEQALQLGLISQHNVNMILENNVFLNLRDLKAIAYNKEYNANLTDLARQNFVNYAKWFYEAGKASKSLIREDVVDHSVYMQQLGISIENNGKTNGILRIKSNKDLIDKLREFNAELQVVEDPNSEINFSVSKKQYELIKKFQRDVLKK